MTSGGAPDAIRRAPAGGRGGALLPGRGSAAPGDGRRPGGPGGRGLPRTCGPRTPGRVVGLLVPHAGLAYSGLVAAAAWRLPRRPRRSARADDRAPRDEPSGGVARRRRGVGSRAVAHSAGVGRRRSRADGGRPGPRLAVRAGSGVPSRGALAGGPAALHRAPAGGGDDRGALGGDRHRWQRGRSRRPARAAARGSPSGGRRHRPRDQQRHGPLPAGGRGGSGHGDASGRRSCGWSRRRSPSPRRSWSGTGPGSRAGCAGSSRPCSAWPPCGRWAPARGSRWQRRRRRTRAATRIGRSDTCRWRSRPPEGRVPGHALLGAGAQGSPRARCACSVPSLQRGASGLSAARRRARPQRISVAGAASVLLGNLVQVGARVVVRRRGAVPRH